VLHVGADHTEVVLTLSQSFQIPAGCSGEARWCDPDACREHAGVQAAIPDGDDQVRVVEGQRARQVHGVRTAKGVALGQLAGERAAHSLLQSLNGQPSDPPGTASAPRLLIRSSS
jgi:hypothetical protein